MGADWRLIVVWVSGLWRMALWTCCLARGGFVTLGARNGLLGTVYPPTTHELYYGGGVGGISGCNGAGLSRWRGGDAH